MNKLNDRGPSGGLPYALGAYTIWGLMPLYLMVVRFVPPVELVGWRIIFTLPLCLAIVALRGQGADLVKALRDRRALGLLLVSSILIGTNWLVYILAIQHGHYFAASLGYYINPLINVLAGTIFLGERLSRLQWVAVGIAALAVGILAWGARDMLGISLTLAFSFCAYGIVRKLVSVGSLPGLTIESAILLLPAAGVVAWFAAGPQGTAIGSGFGRDALIAFAGVVTAVPLLLFATAARRMDYSVLGFIQYLAPTIVFLLGLFYFKEALRPIQLACFIGIWSALAIFCWDLYSRSLKRRREA
ncbi:permease [Novosphingobium marinum]|uniref:Chloramphenicol-sensitive protein RarD n=1 Tax=Novosphingobium marinum TaxID=1514948 RepID=A0A7Y9XVC6_9SPHN|nr:EamA family transporter RarD [Novosphingobium marinum]NYH95170.1 chloramphenicol-sensitive protein RarD [Novosphingobium marinum]GGC24883.1 permease [Novosphingobium marinum]